MEKPHSSAKGEDMDTEKTTRELDEDAEVAHAQWCEEQPPHAAADCPAS
jgi:hypothetical protein